MTLGEKIKDIRTRLGLSQEQLAGIINVSRQAITKWENDTGIPDISNLQELSNVFGVTIDYLLNNDSSKYLTMKIALDKDKYKNKLSSYKEILNEYYPSPSKIYILTYENKLNKIESFFNLLSGGDYNLIKDISNLSPYYLVLKDNLKLLIHISNWTLEVIELPAKTNIKKFTYNNKEFINCGSLK